MSGEIWAGRTVVLKAALLAVPTAVNWVESSVVQLVELLASKMVVARADWWALMTADCSVEKKGLLGVVQRAAMRAD